MARHEPAGRQHAGEPPPSKVKMRFDASTGRFVPVNEPPETTEATEAAERPATPDDPRTTPFRNIPPLGGGV